MRRSTGSLQRREPRQEFAAVQGSRSLERWKAISQIASAIAIPFVLAVVGYFIQKQLADEGLKKDYVSIATTILKENPAGQDPELRRWAVEVLESNSPIPFSRRAKEGLQKGPIFLAVAPPRMPDPPDVCMKPPRPARVQPLVHRWGKQGIKSPEDAKRLLDELLQVAVKAEGEAMEDRIALSCLQRYGNLVAKWSAETAALYPKPANEAPSASAPQ